MNYLEVTIKTTEEMSDSLANLFWELGAGGVVIEDPRVLRRHLEDQTWDYWSIPQALLDAENVILKGYFPVDHRLVGTMAYLKERSEEIKGLFPEGRVEITETEVAAENWATAWKAFYKPERIGERVVVKPSWEQYQVKKEDVLVEMDPGMAFGTGNHPTTVLCIRALEEHIFPDCGVLDIGTGSGILAVTAAKLGAGNVLAVDHDPISIDATQENINLNQVEDLVKVRHGDLVAGVSGVYDIIVANIIADVIMKLIPQAQPLLGEKGLFIASGIIRERLPEVEEIFQKNDFSIDKVWYEGEWVAVIARRS